MEGLHRKSGVLYINSILKNYSLADNSIVGCFFAKYVYIYRMITVEELKYNIENRYLGLNLVLAYGEQSYFYNPDNLLPRGIYFATIKERDGVNDKASHLDRDGVYRLSFGILPKSYDVLFGTKPQRPPKGGIVSTGHLFTQQNVLTPHPVYGWINWVQILNPDIEMIDSLFKLLDEKYEVVKKEYQKKRLK